MNAEQNDKLADKILQVIIDYDLYSFESLPDRVQDEIACATDIFDIKKRVEVKLNTFRSVVPDGTN